MKTIIISVRYLFLMTILLGFVYPLFSSLAGGSLFSRRSSGSLVLIDGQVRGSELIGQSFSQEKYFWSRPSVTNYQAVGAGASNRSATHKTLKEEVLSRREKLGERAPADLLYASASGVDPHISLEAAYFQKERVMKSRGVSSEQLDQMIDKTTDSRLLGFMGQVRVNVLELNKLLDESQQERN